MKKLVLAAVLLCLCACTVDIDWCYFGYAEIKNNTSQTLTISVSVDPASPYYLHYPLLTTSPLDGVVKSKECFTQYYWEPARESIKVGDVPTIVSITIEDGSEIICSSSSDASWSRHFFDSYETRKKVEWVYFQKHEIVIENYVIDDELISLWRQDH